MQLISGALVQIRWNTTARISKSKEPVSTGSKIKAGEALNNTPSKATAPAGGCKQRNLCPRAIADATARPLTSGEVPKRATKVTEEIAPKDFRK